MIIQIDDFIQELTTRTKKKEISWKKVPKNKFYRLIDRSVKESTVKEAYYTVNEESDEVAVIGRLETPKYVDEDEYYLDDSYFVSITDKHFDEATTFLDSDEEVDDEDFSINLARLCRLIKITSNRVDEKINKWFK